LGFHFEDAPDDGIKINVKSGIFVKGTRLTLECSAKANPTPYQYSWQKDVGQPTMLSVSEYSFSSLDYSDNGTYTCTATNSIGSRKSTGFVIVVDGASFRHSFAIILPF